MDQGFDTLPHPTEFRVRVWGKNVKELFRNALRAAACGLKPEAIAWEPARFRERKPFSVEAVDLNSLLVEFLSAALADADTHGMVFADVSFEKFGEDFLEGEFWGTEVEGFDRDIRAVSYEAVDIKRNSETGRYETALVFEV